MKQIMDTPPQSLSRASTVALDSHEREALKTPPTYDSSRSSDVEVIDVETRANPVPKADPATFEPHKFVIMRRDLVFRINLLIEYSWRPP